MNAADKRYTLGWTLGMVSYAFPFLVGSMWFVRKLPPMLNGDVAYQALLHAGLVNIVFTGASGIVFCYYGLRLRIRAFWFLHLAFLLWVVGNDLYATLRAGWLPMPMLPGVLGAAALLLTASCLHKPRGGFATDEAPSA